MTRFRGVVAALLLSCGFSCRVAAQTSEMEADRSHRDTSLQGPSSYDTFVAPVFSHNELLIHASCHQAFARRADIPA